MREEEEEEEEGKCGIFHFGFVLLEIGGEEEGTNIYFYKVI